MLGIFPNVAIEGVAERGVAVVEVAERGAADKDVTLTVVVAVEMEDVVMTFCLAKLCVAALFSICCC